MDVEIVPMFQGNALLFSKLEEECKTHAGAVFGASWPWPLTFWPQNKWFSRSRGGTSVCQVWWSWLPRFLRYRAEKHVDTQTDRRRWKQ